MKSFKKIIPTTNKKTKLAADSKPRSFAAVINMDGNSEIITKNNEEIIQKTESSIRIFEFLTRETI